MQVQRPRRAVDVDVDLVVTGETVRFRKDGEVEPVSLRSRGVGQLALWRIRVRDDVRLGDCSGGRRIRRRRQQSRKSQSHGTHAKIPHPKLSDASNTLVQ